MSACSVLNYHETGLNYHETGNLDISAGKYYHGLLDNTSYKYINQLCLIRSYKCLKLHISIVPYVVLQRRLCMRNKNMNMQLCISVRTKGHEISNSLLSLCIIADGYNCINPVCIQR